MIVRDHQLGPAVCPACERSIVVALTDRDQLRAFAEAAPAAGAGWVVGHEDETEVIRARVVEASAPLGPRWVPHHCPAFVEGAEA